MSVDVDVNFLVGLKKMLLTPATGTSTTSPIISSASIPTIPSPQSLPVLSPTSSSSSTSSTVSPTPALTTFQSSFLRQDGKYFLQVF